MLHVCELLRVNLKYAHSQEKKGKEVSQRCKVMDGDSTSCGDRVTVHANYLIITPHT